jgi:hypothetical protein
MGKQNRIGINFSLYSFYPGRVIQLGSGDIVFSIDGGLVQAGQHSSFDVSDVRRVDDNLYQFLFRVGDE